MCVPLDRMLRQKGRSSSSSGGNGGKSSLLAGEATGLGAEATRSTLQASNELKYLTSPLGEVHSLPLRLNMTLTSSPTWNASIKEQLSWMSWNEMCCG